MDNTEKVIIMIIMMVVTTTRIITIIELYVNTVVLIKTTINTNK